jgi:DNA polymerase I-like protein with 3'-5' exonuclease and polymerase domains
VRLVFDIETDGLLVADRNKPAATKVHSLVIKDIDTGEVTSCWDADSAFHSIEFGLDLLGSASVLIGHNVLTFDIPILQKFYEGFNPHAAVIDTLVCSRLIWSDIKDRDYKAFRLGKIPSQLVGSHSLKAWGYRLGVLKGEFGETTDWKEWSPEMQGYCEQDVEVTQALFAKIEAKNYSPTSLHLEHEFQKIIFEQEKFGFRFDLGKAKELHLKLVSRREALTRDLREMFPPKLITMKTPSFWLGLNAEGAMDRFLTKGDAQKAKARNIQAGPLKIKEIPFNPGSRDHIADRLKERGWVPTKFTNGGKPQVDETVLDEIGTPEAKLLNEYLMVSKRLGQLAEGNEAWLKLERNGRIHGRVITNGAVTGRCTHMKPNVAQTPSVGAPYGGECRALFTADPGFVLVGADASGLELRMFAHYLAMYDGGEYGQIVLNGDIHTRNQELAGLPTRATAKVFIYALLYGAGDAKLGSIVGGGAEEGASLRNRFMKGLPAYAKLVKAVQAAADSKGYLRGLDGRHLHVRSKHAALNTLLQSAGALCVKQATVNFSVEVGGRGFVFGRDYALLAHIHDEMQIQSLPDLAEDFGQALVGGIKAAGRQFGLRIPLDGEYKIGRNWAETH